MNLRQSFLIENYYKNSRKLYYIVPEINKNNVKNGLLKINKIYDTLALIKQFSNLPENDKLFFYARKIVKLKTK